MLAGCDKGFSKKYDVTSKKYTEILFILGENNN